MPIEYTRPPPAAGGITAAQLALLREDLQEDTIQSILAVMNNPVRVRDLLNSPQIYDLRNFLTDEQIRTFDAGGTVNATSAMQEIFEEISAVPGTATQAREAEIIIPAGEALFEINETCTYIGGISVGLTWRGERGWQRGGTEGSGFLWTGAEGGTMFDMRGINASRITDLQFNGGAKAKYELRLREYYDSGVGLGSLIPSTGVVVEFCRFANPTMLDSNSVLCAAGADNGGITLQASEYSFLFCDWLGCNELGQQGWAFKALANGNTKNFFFLYNNIGQVYRGLESGSGRMTCICTTGSNIGYDADDNATLIYGYGDFLTVDTVALENGGVDYAARAIISGGNATGTVLNARGLQLAGTPPADDGIVLVRGGPANIQGNFADNSRAGANSFRVIVNAETTSGYGGVNISNSTWGYNSTPLTSVPVYSGSAAPLATGDYARNNGHKLRCEGNVCGAVGGNKDIQLPDFVGDDIPNLREQMKTDGNTAGLTIVRNCNGSYVVTVPYTVFRTASGGEVVIGELPLKSKLIECIPDTTVAFTGPSGTVEIRAGIDDGSYDDDSLIKPHDVKSGATRKGIVDGDKGVDLALATSVNGRGEYFGAWTGTGHSIKLKMILGAGALTDLVAGSITVYIEHKRVG